MLADLEACVASAVAGKVVKLDDLATRHSSRAMAPDQCVASFGVDSNVLMITASA